MAVALWQARVARGERRIAEQRFELTRQLAGSVLYEFHDGIRDLQGSLKVQQLLLARSMQYLDALAAGAHANPALQRDLANGYERVATLQGSGGTANLGRPEAAIQSLQKALQLRQQVLASNPASVEFRRELARTHRIFSEINASGSERLEHAQAALSLVEALFRQNPNDAGIRNDLANAEYAMAAPLQQQSRFPEAMEYLRKALGHTPDTYPGNAALYHKRLGAILIHTGDLHSALAEYQAAVAIDEPRAAANPSDARARLDLTYGYSDMGLILRGLGRFPEALQQYRKAGKIRAEAAAADPRDARAAGGLATTTMRIADLLAAMGDRRQAEPAYLQAVRVAESFRTRFPEKREAATQLAETCRLLGFSYQSRWSSCAQARPWLDRALAIYRETNDAEGIQVTQGIIDACHF
jgi:tetratricopeptide (TPR) repeat protein